MARHRARIQPHVFEPFFTQGSRQGQRAGAEPGVRLRRAVGGYAELHSQVGQGTRVRICLPVGEEAA